MSQQAVGGALKALSKLTIGKIARGACTARQGGCLADPRSPKSFGCGDALPDSNTGVRLKSIGRNAGLAGEIRDVPLSATTDFWRRNNVRNLTA